MRAEDVILTVSKFSACHHGQFEPRLPLVRIELLTANVLQVQWTQRELDVESIMTTHPGILRNDETSSKWITKSS